MNCLWCLLTCGLYPEHCVICGVAIPNQTYWLRSASLNSPLPPTELDTSYPRSHDRMIESSHSSTQPSVQWVLLSSGRTLPTRIRAPAHSHRLSAAARRSLAGPVIVKHSETLYLIM
ncbi:hypothetical protein PYCCODRAFT_1208512 [Trametes coccinea BRFM310]|uniref:Secreted protein n=1 Tax=Trametes coccinea (strain BRFM310) TaxID=1353009 RepID=A0A1Y2I794_TRAC3|nr:hypothetical protein PYCCODRAFT_1208512 [Trametes coccinea BRFM310]